VRSDRFEWDDGKAAENLDKHNVSFDKATEVFDDPLGITFFDERNSLGELREISVGFTFFDELLIVSHTTRGERIRIISARRANKTERRRHMEKNHDQINDTDDLLPHYDFDYSKGVRGKYYQGRGRLVIRVSLDADVARVYSTTESVNAALRMLIAEGRAPEPRNE
jgi:uncharacterized protein